MAVAIYEVQNLFGNALKNYSKRYAHLAQEKLRKNARWSLMFVRWPGGRAEHRH